MLGEEEEDHLLGDIDYVYEDEAVQEHGKLVLGVQEVLEASRELWGREESRAGKTGSGCQAESGAAILLLCLPEWDLRQVVVLTGGK